MLSLTGAWLARFLSLSTNGIEKISNLAGLESLQCLSMGRNLIKKLEGLEPVAATLEELWLSYNALEKLVSCLMTV
jgi:dynein light chain 1